MWRSRWLLFLALGAVLIVSAAGIVLSLALSPNATQETALTYAKNYMHWYAGPKVQTVRPIEARNLNAVLHTTVPVQVSRDVDAPGIVKQYGPTHRLDLVVLTGTYDSLPPDEGLPVHGDIVVLVDPHNQHIILVTG